MMPHNHFESFKSNLIKASGNDLVIQNDLKFKCEESLFKSLPTLMLEFKHKDGGTVHVNIPWQGYVKKQTD